MTSPSLPTPLPILRQHLRAIADAALRAVSAELLTARAVAAQPWRAPRPDDATPEPSHQERPAGQPGGQSAARPGGRFGGRLVVIAAGKPASAMVRGFLQGFEGRAAGREDQAADRAEDRADGGAGRGTARAAERAAGRMLPAGVPHGGLLHGMIATAHAGDGLPGSLRLFVAGHPVPTAGSVDAGRHALALAGEASPDDRLIVLLSGGASALLAAPADGLTLDDKVQATRALLAGGAAIHELNAVRKHLSAIKGGRLAAAARCPVHTFALSDVISPVDDDPGVIGSGPTVADATTFADALAAIDRLGVRASMPRAAIALLESGAAGRRSESPKPGDPRLARASYTLIGSRRDAMAAARAEAERLGFTTFVIEEAVSGEARQAAPRLLAYARALVAGHAAGATGAGATGAGATGDRTASAATAGQTRAAGASQGPYCVIASGETTVRVTGTGRGGRNQEFVLALADALEEAGAGPVAGPGAGPVVGPVAGLVAGSLAGSIAGAPGDPLAGPFAGPPIGRSVGPFVDPRLDLSAAPPSIVAASIGTDGIDGPTDAAGGIVDSTTARRLRERGLGAARAFLANNDAYRCLDALGDLIRTGPTDTNVGDLQIILIG